MKLGIPKIFKSLNELFDRFKFQLYVLCIWKNIQIYKRNKVRLCMEILWPLLFVGVVVLMRYNYGDRAYLRQDECHFYSKPLLSAGFFEFLHGYICHFNNTCHQEYVENDNFFANQTSQLSAAFLEINEFMGEDKNVTENILIQFLTQLGQYDSLKNDNKQTHKTYQRSKFRDATDHFSMDNFINLHQYFRKILRLPKMRRVLRHFQPLLYQFKKWISGNPTLFDDDIIAIIGGMKLICGPKFYLDNEHVEKINTQTFLEKMLLKPFITENQDMKSEFCRNLDEKIKEIPMLNKIWISIKPLFVEKLLFTPRNAATWKIMQNINSTFQRFAFYHKFTRDFINFLNVAFQKIKDIQGEEAFAKHNIDILSFTIHLEMAYNISSKISEALDCLNVDRIEGFSTESEMIDHARYYIDRNTFFAGVVFLDMEDNKKEGPTDNLTTMLNFVRYKIRMDSQKIEPTDSLFDNNKPYPPRRHPLTHLNYYYHGFVILQELLDTAITDISSSNSILSESYIHKPKVTLQQTPHPCYNRDEFLRSFHWILPLQICLGWSLTIAIIILNMTEESKNRLHHYYRIWKMNDTILILAQLATFLIPMSITSTLTAVILFKGRILLYSDTLAIVLILFNYGLATVCLGILFGTFLRKHSVSPYIGILLYLLITFIPYYMNKAQPSLVLAQRILWLIPSVPFLESFINIIDLEIGQVGLQWDKIVFQQTKTSMSFVDNLTIMIFDAILFIGTSIMIEKAKTTFVWETYIKFWKIIRKKFFRITRKKEIEEVNLEKKFIQNNLYMEIEPANSKCSLEIINLTKVTINGRILDNISLKFYENQLICILIDNSLTGNALLSMIRKLQNIDSGSIYYGNNHQTIHDCSNIGYMPAYDITINALTVEENLWFYTKLKDSEKNIRKKDIEEIMKSAYLYNVRHTQAKQLSISMNRRLCVAIAFMGKCELVLLQDPFFGLDFYSKHVMCDMLVNYKKGRTIVLTTNDANNTKIISDKIAIINNGRLLCYGSKTFLRTIFTKGFEIKVEIDRTENIMCIAKQFKFLNLPENLETDVKDGLPDIQIIAIFTHIMRHFIPNSYFVEAPEQKFKFILPYIIKDGIYDCIGNTLALKKLFCLLDRCKNKYGTLKYEFTTNSILEVYENIKLFEMSNRLSNDNGFVYEIMDSTKLFHTLPQLDLITNNTATASTNAVNYSILSSDSLSEHFVSFKQFSSIQIARFKKNYRNLQFGLQLFLAPMLILYFATIWIRFIQTPSTIYPVPLSILLYPYDTEIFAKGLKLEDQKNVNKNAKGVGDLTMEVFVESPTSLYIRSIGNKCVYLMEYTSTDFSECQKNDTTCSINVISNNIKSPIELGYRKIYKDIFTRVCQAQKMNKSLKLHRFQIIPRKRRSFQSKCICDNRDGQLSCSTLTLKPIVIPTSTLYIVKKIDHIPSLPAYLPSFTSKIKYIVGGFEMLIKNNSNIAEKNCNYKMQEFFYKVMKNNSIFPPKLKIVYLNQMHIFQYLTHISNDSMKIWFNNRLKIGMPSILSIYDTAYFRTVTVLRNIPSSGSNIADKIKYPVQYKQVSNIFNIPTTNYIDIYGGNDYGLITINHPIYSSFKRKLKLSSTIYLYIIIFVQICVVSLIATLIIRDMLEEASYPHRFQLHKIFPLFETIFNIVYNFGIYIMAINICFIVFIINIKLDRFDYLNGIALYVLYGWAIIPFMLAVTYMHSKCSLLDLNIINNGIGFLCLLLEFTLNIFEFQNITLMLILTVFIPHYGFEKVMVTLIGTIFSQYENRSIERSENKWKYSLFIALIISGILYSTLVYCCEYNILKKGKEILKNYLKGIKIFNYLNIKMAMLCLKKAPKEVNLQKNVLKAKYDNNSDMKVVELEKKEAMTSDPFLYPILIRNLTTSQLLEMNIKVENGCCVGLLGMKSGMIPFVRLLTGESISYQGEINIFGHNIRMNQFNILSSIGYAPNDLYSNAYLTPKECIEFYTDQKYEVSSKAKKVADFLINHFNIKENKLIKDCSESTKKKILLAIALMLNPSILIITEPWKGLNSIDTSIVKKTILDWISMGKCILVVSDTFQNCRCYTKLAIFAGKEMNNFGSIQQLESRYTDGYMVSMEFNKDRQKKFRNNTCDLLVQRLKGTFACSKIVEYHMSYLEILICSFNLQISRIFVVLEAVRSLYDIYDYSIRFAPLEEILSKCSNSHEDLFNENVITHRRPCDIPYASHSF